MVLEAEVKCRRCKVRKWVAWNLRHQGKKPGLEDYIKVRCGSCPTGQDMTDYTGRTRGEVEVGPKGFVV